MSVLAPPPTAGRRRKPLLVKPANLGDMIDEERYKPIEWPMVRRLLSTLGPYKKQYLFGLALGLVHVTCDLSGPLFMKRLIDFGQAFVPVKSPSSVPSKLYSLPGAVEYLTIVVVIWALVAVTSFILQRATILVITRAGE